jgi:diguanylate cyclase (GGDEF)-like protein
MGELRTTARWRAAAAITAFAAITLSGVGTDHQRLVLADLTEIVAPLIAALVAFRAGRRHAGAAARGWTLLALSCSSWAIGQAIWSWYELVSHTDPFPSPADAGFLVAVPLGWAAMVSFHKAWRRPSAAGVATLDGVAASSALLIISWIVILRPSWDGTVSLFDLTLSLAYPAGGAITIAVVLSVVAGAHRDARRRVALVTGGYLLLASADSLFALLTLHGEPSVLTTSDIGWVAGFLVLAVAASGPVLTDSADTTVPSPLWLGLLPYVPVGLAVGFAVVDIGPNGRVDAVVLFAAAVMVTAILGRQAATMIENQGLVRALAGKVGELESSEAHLRHQAFHDGLTGLANRELFADRVQHALARHLRDGAPVTVLLLDLDDFKNVNDSLGHFVGDQLLIEVGARLARVLRPGDTVARLGGDEFAVLLEAGDRPQLPEVVADRLLAELHAPVRLADRSVTIRASIGYSVARPGTTAEELLGDADLALYAAKGSGKQSARPFEGEMRSAVVNRMELSAALELAVPDELEVHYQTIHSTVGGHVTGAEALVRWRHPVRGLLGPDTFIPLAEETGLIVPIGHAVLEAACKQAQIWRSSGDVPDLQMNVNLSGRQLFHNELVEDVERALLTTGLPPSALVLEITESVLTPPGPELLDRLHGLKDLGVQLAVDDFGAGYSSLNYLRTLPVDVLKIDKVFIDGAGRGGQADVLLRAIIELGHSLGLVVVAEGVERAEQLFAVRQLGCEQAQGYLLGRPVPSDIVRLRASEDAPVA